MMEAAEQDAVSQAGGAALAAGDDVVHVACCRGLVAAGRSALPVPHDDRAAQVRRDDLSDGADVQGQADRGGGLGEGSGAQPGGQAAGSGQQGGRALEDELAGAGLAQLAVQPVLVWRGGMAAGVARAARAWVTCWVSS